MRVGAGGHAADRRPSPLSTGLPKEGGGGRQGRGMAQRVQVQARAVALLHTESKTSAGSKSAAHRARRAQNRAGHSPTPPAKAPSLTESSLLPKSGHKPSPTERVRASPRTFARASSTVHPQWQRLGSIAASPTIAEPPDIHCFDRLVRRATDSGFGMVGSDSFGGSIAPDLPELNSNTMFVHSAQSFVLGDARNPFTFAT